MCYFSLHCAFAVASGNEAAKLELLEEDRAICAWIDGWHGTFWVGRNEHVCVCMLWTSLTHCQG